MGPDARRLSAAAVVWIAVLISLTVWGARPSYVVGWDLRVYEKALISLQAGDDPYEDGMAAQRIFHARLAQLPQAPTPYTYVYSPITLPLMRCVEGMPSWAGCAFYGMAYAAGALLMVRVGLWAAERDERQMLAVLAPLSILFPGMLEQDMIFSGNIAVLLYGLVLGAAYVGWKRGRWLPFYAVVVFASCFKAPWLSLLAIPVLSARRQWKEAGVSAAIGVGLFAVQPLIWPAAFHHYLEAVELQFSYNRDFSSSPAGIAAGLLFNRVPYQLTWVVVYLLYAVPVAGVLFRFSRRYLAGDLRLKQWAPLLLIGVMLLNPRIMEYDLAPVALPMALVMWRVFARNRSRTQAVLCLALFFVAVNALALLAWKTTESLLLLLVFSAGRGELLLQMDETRSGSGALELPGFEELEPTAGY